MDLEGFSALQKSDESLTGPLPGLFRGKTLGDWPQNFTDPYSEDQKSDVHTVNKHGNGKSAISIDSVLI